MAEIRQVKSEPRKTRKLVPLTTYLHAFMRQHNLRPHHFRGLQAFARGRTVATKEQWDQLFKDYGEF